MRKFSLFSVGRHYVNHLIETCEFDSAAALLPRVFRGEKRLWQEEILRFIRLNQVASIGRKRALKKYDQFALITSCF